MIKVLLFKGAPIPVWLITYHNLATMYSLNADTISASFSTLVDLLQIAMLQYTGWVQNDISPLFQSFMFQFASTSTLNLIWKEMSPWRTFPFLFPIIAIPFRKILNLKYVIIKKLVSLFQRASTAARIGMSTESSRSVRCVLSIKYVPLSQDYTTLLWDSRSNV